MGGGRERRRSNDGFVYLSEDARKNLPHYQYKGEDRSPLYNYIHSPLALFLVNNCTPRSVAPNTITLIGLCFMVASYMLMWYHAPSLELNDAVPSWIFCYHALAMIFYQTLDNMDGKQARRTQSSSPLGLLFDHGCDSVNSLFGSMGWILGLGLTLDSSLDCFMIWGILLGPYAMFYVATWEEYHTGELILPFINGPNEGITGGAMLSLTTCLYGVEFWQATSFYDAFLAPHFGDYIPPLRNADLQVGVSILGMIHEVLSKSTFVVKRHGLASLISQLPLWTLIGSMLLLTVQSLVWIQTMPRTLIHLSCGLFCESVTQLMLNHISHTRFVIFDRMLFLWPLIGIVIVAQLELLTDESSTIQYSISIYTYTLWLYMAYKVQQVVHEMCVLLDLKCFDITTSKTATAQKSQ